MGRRQRKRRREPGSAAATAPATTDHTHPDGDGALTLRDELSAGTLRALDRLEAKPAASAEDRARRRTELLFERLAVRWEIAGLPLEDQRELLGRYRLASSDERRWVHRAITEHLRTHYPDLEV